MNNFIGSTTMDQFTVFGTVVCSKITTNIAQEIISVSVVAIIIAESKITASKAPNRSVYVISFYYCCNLAVSNYLICLNCAKACIANPFHTEQCFNQYCFLEILLFSFARQ